MVNDIRIYIAIGIFMLISISLMIFNLVIIYYSKNRDAYSSKRNKKWRGVIYRQSGIAPGKKQKASKHEKFLLKKLSNPENLVAYSNALQYLKNEFYEEYRDYINKIYPIFLQLANKYGKKPSIEKACYADFVCNFPQIAKGGMYGHLVDTIITYTDDSSIHCSVNVLRALCSISSTEGVVRTLQMLNDESVFVHNLTLINELSNFNGDKEVLLESLHNKNEHIGKILAYVMASTSASQKLAGELVAA